MSISFSEKFYLTFRALRHRNFKLFFAGQCVSLIGTWIQQVAMSWLIYRLTGSALLMGTIIFAGATPSLLLSPFAGVLVDRINKYKTLIIVQSLFMIETFIFALLIITGIIKVWHIILLSILMGITNAIDMPLRQAFVVLLVEGNDDLSNAISLNSSSFNLARLVGPAIAGILIAAVGEGICFLLNALSYIAVIAALLAMKINYIPVNKPTKINILEEFNEGVQYTISSRPIRSVLIYLAFISLIGMSYPVLMPIFAKEILHGDAQTLGFLMSSSGVGALFGALYLAGRRSVSGLEKWVFIASLCFGIGLIGEGFATNIPLALCLLFFVGYGMVVIIAACNTLIQHFVDDDKRGRVMSLYTMAFMGTVPFGSLCGGAVAERIGVPDTFIVCGLVIFVAALIFSTKLKYFDTKTT